MDFFKLGEDDDYDDFYNDDYDSDLDEKELRKEEKRLKKESEKRNAVIFQGHHTMIIMMTMMMNLNIQQKRLL